MDYQHIVVAIDFSPFAGHALQVGARLASARNEGGKEGRFSALHACEPGTPITESSRKLEAFCEDWLDADAPRPARVVTHGTPAYAAVDWARASNADLLLCGSYGKTGLTRLLLGSFAEKMVQLAPCPVWVVRAQERGWRFNRLLFPTDFSRASDRAGKKAIELVRQFGGVLDVIHVLSPPVLQLGGSGLDHFFEGARRTAQACIADSFCDTDISLSSEIAVGAPARAIVDYSKTSGADLLVCGTRGRTGIERMLVGSVAERLVRWSPCSVLVVPASP